MRRVRALRRLTAAMVTLAALGCVALVLAGCGGDPAPVQRSEADSGQAVTVSQGAVLRISLRGNPTTGFTWEPQGLPDFLRQTGEPVYASESTLLGAGGTFTFSFEGVKAGKGTLKLVYHRVFEPGVPPEKVFTLDVTVK